jgi:hypothetical protein
MLPLPASNVPVCQEVDVVVVGGGESGHSAAVAAARQGVSVALVERHGHMGGKTTGGLITVIHSMSDGTGNRVIAGQCQEWLDRLCKWGAANPPAPEETGTTDPAVLARYEGVFFRREGRLIYGSRVDGEILKCVLNDMIEESGVRLYLHSLVTDVLTEDRKLRGIVFDSKSGKRAILAKVVIDASGDAGVAARVGCSFEDSYSASNSISCPGLGFEFGNVNWPDYEAFKRQSPEEHVALMQRLREAGGFSMHMKTAAIRDTVCHFNMFLPGYNVLDVDDLTRLEVTVRKGMLITWRFFREHIPGFERCFILATAAQVGIRGSRRLLGEYRMTEADCLSGEKFLDTIAEFPPLKGISPQYPHAFIPYRVMLPKAGEADNLLVTGRAFSSDDVVNEHYGTVAHNITLGQSAGTAAAMAAQAGVLVRDVDTAAVRRRLIETGACFPGFA